MTTLTEYDLARAYGGSLRPPTPEPRPVPTPGKLHPGGATCSDCHYWERCYSMMARDADAMTCKFPTTRFRLMEGKP